MKEKNNYYLYDKNIIKYSEKSGYFLMMTGWDKTKNHDRRILPCMINDDKFEKINKNKALEMINTYWNSGVRTWEFNGVKYDNSCENICHCPWHEFEHSWFGHDNIKHTNKYSYKLVWHQGHIYWACWHHYYPRTLLYEFVDLNTEPHDFVKWTKADNCRGIVDLTTNLLV